MRFATLSRLAILVLLVVPLAGCSVATGIFKAGVWVGLLIAVVLVLGVLMLFRRRR